MNITETPQSGPTLPNEYELHPSNLNSNKDIEQVNQINPLVMPFHTSNNTNLSGSYVDGADTTSQEYLTPALNT